MEISATSKLVLMERGMSILYSVCVVAEPSVREWHKNVQALPAYHDRMQAHGLSVRQAKKENICNAFY